jgi:hypothetical protein
MPITVATIKETTLLGSNYQDNKIEAINFLMLTASPYLTQQQWNCQQLYTFKQII